MSDKPEEGEEEEETAFTEDDLEPEDYEPKRKKRDETLRRRKVMPVIANLYTDPNNPVPIEDLVEKFNIPESSIYYYFKKDGISKDEVKQRSPEILKVIRKTEAAELSLEAEKIATIAIGLGGAIARRWLPLIDRLMVENQSIEQIAVDVMSWYEQRAPINAKIMKLEATIHELENELSKMFSMNEPNFRYVLRTKLVEKYAMQVLLAKVYGVQMPVKKTLQAYYNDLLSVEGDISDTIKKLEEMVNL